jgi:BirA family transcriptional regulator, biotin operon repressor / biotin---[acetyl-CoA-carboxylase] ligase
VEDEPQVVHLKSVPSTQDVARDLPIGSIVLADHQSAGRGRQDHRWEAPEGAALLVSFVLPPNPLLSVAAGVAAAEACGPRVRLKWPNDLLLEGKKLGGILVEATSAKAICGIGINLSWAPEGAAMVNQPRDELFNKVRVSVARWSAAPADEVISRWRELSATLGRRVRLTLPNQSVEGVADDVSARGELIIDGVGYSAGSLTHL